jgi:hypothetical protein
LLNGDGEPALMVAIAIGNEEAIQFIWSVAKIHTQTENHETVLHYAARHNNPVMALQGCDPRYKIPVNQQSTHELHTRHTSTTRRRTAVQCGDSPCVITAWGSGQFGRSLRKKSQGQRWSNGGIVRRAPPFKKPGDFYIREPTGGPDKRKSASMEMSKSTRKWRYATWYDKSASTQTGRYAIWPQELQHRQQERLSSQQKPKHTT